MGALAVKDVEGAISQLEGLEKKSAKEIDNIYNFDLLQGEQID